MAGFQQGTAFVLLRTKVPVVPISLRGALGLFSGLSCPDRLHENVEVILHPPVDPAKLEETGGTSPKSSRASLRRSATPWLPTWTMGWRTHPPSSRRGAGSAGRFFQRMFLRHGKKLFPVNFPAGDG